MIKLKHILQYREFYLYALFILIFVLFNQYIYFYMILIILLYFLKKRISFLLLSILFFLIIINSSIIKRDEGSIDSKFIIIEINELEYGYRYTVKNIFNQYEFYASNYLNLYSSVKIEGELQSFKKTTTPHGFDEEKYKLGQNVSAEIKIKSLIILNEGIKINKQSFFIKYLNNERLIENDFIGYLFKLNSLTLLSLIYLIKKVLFYFDIEENKKNIFLTFLFLLLYSLGRSFLFLFFLIKTILNIIDGIFELALSELDKRSIIFIILLVINPFYIYNYSFISVFLFFIMMYFNHNANTHLNMFYILLISLPLQILFTSKVSLVLTVFVYIFRSISKYIFIPMLLFSIFLPVFDYFFFLNSVLNLITDFLNSIDVVLYIKYYHTFFIVLYYLLILIIFNTKSLKALLIKLLAFILILIIFILSHQHFRKDRVVFLDVNQGDSAVIYKNNQIIVIDAFKGVSAYLKSEGINQIDHLILTHNDYDHIAEVSTLMNDFKIGKVYLSGYQTYDYQISNFTLIDDDNLLEIEELELTFLGPFIDFKNDNANSIVLLIKVNQSIFLFTGDIDIDAEEKYVEKYGLKLQADVLKVAHHGSITSSSYHFLNYVNPRFAVVSVGLNNAYNLPDNEVINRFQNLGISIYFTSIHGTIIFKDNEIVNFAP